MLSVTSTKASCSTVLLIGVVGAAARGAAAADEHHEGNWISFSETKSFQPSTAFVAENPSLFQRLIRRLSFSSKNPYVKQDGYYSGYQQVSRFDHTLSLAARFGRDYRHLHDA